MAADPICGVLVRSETGTYRAAGPPIQLACDASQFPVRNSDGTLGCRLIEAGRASCDAPGRSSPMDLAPGQCLVIQRSSDRTVPTEPGWYFSDGVAEENCGGSIAFVAGSEPDEDTMLTLDCILERRSCE